MAVFSVIFTLYLFNVFTIILFNFNISQSKYPFAEIFVFSWKIMTPLKFYLSLQLWLW
jgi:hypothetical protein